MGSNFFNSFVSEFFNKSKAKQEVNTEKRPKKKNNVIHFFNHNKNKLDPVKEIIYLKTIITILDTTNAYDTKKGNPETLLKEIKALVDKALEEDK